MKQNTAKPIQVTVKDYSTFHRRWSRGEFGDQRLGQAIVNQFWERPKDSPIGFLLTPVSDLFYVDNKDLNKIVHDYVEFLPVYA